MRRRLLYTSLVAGVISITAQSLIIRELVITFLGNELVIGITLGAWLLWSALGSATIGRLGERSGFSTGWLAVELMLLAVLLPLCFLATGQVRAFAGLESGEIAGPITILVGCLAVLGPACLLNGSIFPTLCRAAAAEMPKDAAIARVYVWEAIGSATGGILFTVAIIRLDQPAFAILGCSVAAVGFAVAAVRERKTAAVIAGGIALAAAAVLSLEAVDRSQHINTIYGRTSVTSREETLSVFNNGMLSWTHPPAGMFERLVHLAMLQVERPRRVLLIGGLGGTAEEVLKYLGVEPDIVELDPDSVNFVRRLGRASPRLDEALANGQARLIFQDGRRHIARYRGAPYDAVILNLPKPVSAQINRYYTVEFFRAARDILSERGVLAFSVESAENISTVEVREFIACLKRTLEAAFEHVAVAPGTSNTFVAARRAGRVTLDPLVLLGRLGEREIETGRFEATIAADLNLFKVDELRETLAESRSTRINTDLHPISYSHGLAVWRAKDRAPRPGPWQSIIDAPIRLLNGLAAWPPDLCWRIGGSVLLLCACAFLLVRPSRGAAAGLAVGCSGFTEIAIEIVALLAFQALYGYVYAMLGLVLASFMVGLCVGGGCASRIIHRRARSFRWLLGTQVMLTVYPLVLIGVIWGARRTDGAGWPVAAAFLALTFVAGFTGGMQFPLATSVASRRKHGVAARFSALDLCGAALGAIAVSALIIPTLGFVTLAVLLSGLGLVPLLALCLARARAETPLAP